MFPAATSGDRNLGDAMITAGGVIFAGGATDHTLHAFDIETGKELWSASLPAGVHASPMTYVTASGRQFIVVAAGGHKELHVRAGDFDKPGDYIAAFALPSSRGPETRPSGAIAAGHYEGHIVLDRTRLGLTWELTVNAATATVSFETVGIQVAGHGRGHADGDTLTLDAEWTFPAQHCSGTLHLQGTNANYDTAIIGELTYVDGCAGGGTKSGTFAMWRGRRMESVVSR